MKRNKKGFSLVEVIIALSAIVIVSIATLTIVLSSVNARKKAADEAEALRFAENIYECYKAADGDDVKDAFLKNVQFLLGDEYLKFVETDSGWEYSKESSFYAKIELDGEKMTVTVKDKKQEKTYVSLTFDKGGDCNEYVSS